MPKVSKPFCNCNVDRLDDKRFIRRTIPRLPNFLTQVLYAIQTIRCKRGRGATLGEICSFMRNSFGATGDVRSRVDTTIAKAKCDGFCIEKGGKYVLVTPLARMQNARSRAERHTIIKQMQTIFLYKPNMSSRRHRAGQRSKSNCNPTSTEPTRRRNTISKSEIVSVLKHIESVLMKHLVRSDEDEAERTPRLPASQKSNLKKSDLHINKTLSQPSRCSRRRTDGYHGSNLKRAKKYSDYSKDSSNSKASSNLYD